jgi:adenylate cyclase
MPTDEIVDVGETPVELRRRHVLSRVGIPIVAVALIVVVVFAIAFYAERANSSGVLLLSDDLLATLGERISQEVASYLDPAIRVTRLARDATTQLTIADPLAALQALASSALKQIPQVDALYSGDGSGNFIMVQRGAAGGTTTKLIRNTPGSRRVELIRYDADGRVIGRQEVQGDDYDPRTRDWYKGALNTDDVFWTDTYVFYTHREPGITASIRYGNAGRVFGVDITLKVLSDFLASLKIGRSGRAIIIDHRGNLIAAPSSSKLLPTQADQAVTARIDDLGDPVLTAVYDRYRIEGYGRRTITVDDRAIVSIAARLPTAGYSWSLLMVVPEKDYTGFIAQNSRNSLWLSLVLVGLAAALAVLLVRQGLRADRTAQQLLERSKSIERQSLVFSGLARERGFLDRSQDAPLHDLSAALADLSAGRRASIWQASSNGRMLNCEDAYERETHAHVAGLRLARSELPRFFAALESADEIEAEDAAADLRTSELHRVLMHPFRSRSLFAVPVPGPEGVLGVIIIEDATRLSGARDISVLAANMLAIRFQRGAEGLVAPDVGTVEAPPVPIGERSLTAELVEPLTSTSMTGAEVFSSVAVMTIQFDDDAAIAASDAASGEVFADRLAATLQQIAAAHQIPYVKLLGHDVIAAAGLTRGDSTAIVRIADAAVTCRDRCLEMFEANRKPPSFRIGMDCAVAIGSYVGSGPRLFNLWGSAVRTAELMARTSAEPGTIQVSEAAYHRLRQQFLLRLRGGFFLPDVGASQTFVLGGRQ